MNNDLAVSLAQAIEEIRASLVWLRETAIRMIENRRMHSWRWRTSTLMDSRTFIVDHEVRYWSVYIRSTGGSGMVTVSPGPSATPLESVDGFSDLGLGGFSLGSGSWLTIPTNERRFTVQVGNGITNLDCLVVAHQGGYDLIKGA